MAAAPRYKPLRGFAGNLPEAEPGNALLQPTERRPDETRQSLDEVAHNLVQQDELARSAWAQRAEEYDTRALLADLVAERQAFRRQASEQAQQVRPNAPIANDPSPMPELSETHLDHGGGLSIWHLPHLVLRNLWLVVVCTLLLGLGALAFLATQERDYHAIAQLSLDPGEFTLSSNDTQTQGGDSIENARVDSEVYTILSSRVLRQVVLDLDLVDDPALEAPTSSLRYLFGDETEEQRQERRVLETIQALDSRTDVARLDPSFIFEIAAKHPEPDRARDIANSIASNFLQLRNQDRRQNEESTASALSERAADLLADLRRKEQAVQDWKIDNSIVTTGESGLIADQRAEQLNAQIVAARVALAQAEGRFEQVNSLSDNAALTGSLPEFIISPAITTLRTQLDNLDAEDARLSVSLGPRHPRRQILDQQRSRVRQQLADAVQRQRNSIVQAFDRAKAQVDALEREAARQQAENASSGPARIELEQLQREAAIARQLYQDVQNSARQLREQAGVNLSKAKLVSAADTPLYPIGPSRLMVLAAALMFGALLGSALAVALDLLRGVLLTRGQIIQKTQLPIVGSLASRAYFGAPWWQSIFHRFGFLRARSIEGRRKLVLQGLGNRLRNLGDGHATSVAFVSSGAGRTNKIASDLVATLDAAHAGVVFAKYNRKSAPHQTLVSGRNSTDLMALLAADAHAGRCELVTNTGPHRKPELVVVECPDALRDPRLADLMNAVDRAVITAEVGRTSSYQLTSLAEALAPWRSRLAGVVTQGIPL
ncbi:MAG: GumC family protein [Pseudomonadota bacterium]